MKVVVTGGAGFIGTQLCAALGSLDDVDAVVAFDDLSTGRADSLSGLPVELVAGSILDDTFDDVVAGADAIVHLGGRRSVARSVDSPGETHDANATGTLRVLEAARRLSDPLVIVASSSSVYGANPVLPMDEALTPMPMSPYAVSKLAAEQYALVWQRCYSVRTLALRLFNVYGPGQPADAAYATVIPTFIAAALAGRALPVDGDGEQSRDFTHVATVCATIVAALRRGVTSPTPVNVAGGRPTTVLGLVAVIEELIGQPLPIEWCPGRVGDVRHSHAASGRFRALFPEVTPVELRAGIAETIAWFRAR